MVNSKSAMRLKAVNHVTYNVIDKKRALRFWEDILGVKQIPSQVESNRILWLQLPDGTMVHLIENDDGISTPSHHTAFEVDDIDGIWDDIRSKGIETTEITVRKDGQREFKLDDSEGNRIEICTKSGFGVLV